MEIEVNTYLKAESVEDGAVGVILDEGHYRDVEETGFENKVFEIGVKIGDVEFQWTMNSTSQRNLATKWGKDTQKWIGKQIKFRKVTQQVFNKMKEVLYADPVESVEKTDVGSA